MQVVFPDDWNGAFAGAPRSCARLRQRADVNIFRVRPDDVVDAVRDADVVVALRERTRYDARVLQQMPNLKLIVSVGGRDNPSIDKDVAMDRGVLVCYTAGALPDSLPPPAPGNPSMTEMALGMMISVMRGFDVQDRAMHTGEWPGPIGRVLYGKTLGIVGLGRLGSDLARVGQFLGMRVVAAGVTLTPERAAAAGVEFRSLDDLFSEADVVSIHLKSVALQYPRAGERAVAGARMKPDAGANQHVAGTDRRR